MSEFKDIAVQRYKAKYDKEGNAVASMIETDALVAKEEVRKARLSSLKEIRKELEDLPKDFDEDYVERLKSLMPNGMKDETV
jgi:predicted outer membrane protein